MRSIVLFLGLAILSGVHAGPLPDAATVCLGMHVSPSQTTSEKSFPIVEKSAWRSSIDSKIVLYRKSDYNEISSGYAESWKYNLTEDPVTRRLKLSHPLSSDPTARLETFLLTPDRDLRYTIARDGVNPDVRDCATLAPDAEDTRALHLRVGFLQPIDLAAAELVGSSSALGDVWRFKQPPAMHAGSPVNFTMFFIFKDSQISKSIFVVEATSKVYCVNNVHSSVSMISPILASYMFNAPSECAGITGHAFARGDAPQVIGGSSGSGSEAPPPPVPAPVPDAVVESEPVPVSVPESLPVSVPVPVPVEASKEALKPVIEDAPMAVPSTPPTLSKPVVAMYESCGIDTTPVEETGREGGDGSDAWVLKKFPVDALPQSFHAVVEATASAWRKPAANQEQVGPTNRSLVYLFHSEPLGRTRFDQRRGEGWDVQMYVNDTHYHMETSWYTHELSNVIDCEAGGVHPREERALMHASSLFALSGNEPGSDHDTAGAVYRLQHQPRLRGVVVEGWRRTINLPPAAGMGSMDVTWYFGRTADTEFAAGSDASEKKDVEDALRNRAAGVRPLHEGDRHHTSSEGGLVLQQMVVSFVRDGVRYCREYDFVDFSGLTNDEAQHALTPPAACSPAESGIPERPPELAGAQRLRVRWMQFERDPAVAPKDAPRGMGVDQMRARLAAASVARGGPSAEAAAATFHRLGDRFAGVAQDAKKPDGHDVMRTVWEIDASSWPLREEMLFRTSRLEPPPSGDSGYDRVALVRRAKAIGDKIEATGVEDTTSYSAEISETSFGEGYMSCRSIPSMTWNASLGGAIHIAPPSVTRTPHPPLMLAIFGGDHVMLTSIAQTADIRRTGPSCSPAHCFVKWYEYRASFAPGEAPWDHSSSGPAEIVWTYVQHPGGFDLVSVELVEKDNESGHGTMGIRVELLSRHTQAEDSDVSVSESSSDSTFGREMFLSSCLAVQGAPEATPQLPTISASGTVKMRYADESVVETEDVYFDHSEQWVRMDVHRQLSADVSLLDVRHGVAVRATSVRDTFTGRFQSFITHATRADGCVVEGLAARHPLIEDDAAGGLTLNPLAVVLQLNDTATSNVRFVGRAVVGALVADIFRSRDLHMFRGQLSTLEWAFASQVGAVYGQPLAMHAVGKDGKVRRQEFFEWAGGVPSRMALNMPGVCSGALAKSSFGAGSVVAVFAVASSSFDPPPVQASPGNASVGGYGVEKCEGTNITTLALAALVGCVVGLALGAGAVSFMARSWIFRAVRQYREVPFDAKEL